MVFWRLLLYAAIIVPSVLVWIWVVPMTWGIFCQTCSADVLRDVNSVILTLLAFGGVGLDLIRVWGDLPRWENSYSGDVQALSNYPGFKAVMYRHRHPSSIL